MLNYILHFLFSFGCGLLGAAVTQKVLGASIIGVTQTGEPRWSKPASFCCIDSVGVIIAMIGIFFGAVSIFASRRYAATSLSWFALRYGGIYLIGIPCGYLQLATPNPAPGILVISGIGFMLIPVAVFIIRRL